MNKLVTASAAALVAILSAGDASASRLLYAFSDQNGQSATFVTTGPQGDEAIVKASGCISLDSARCSSGYLGVGFGAFQVAPVKQGTTDGYGSYFDLAANDTPGTYVSGQARLVVSTLKDTDAVYVFNDLVGASAVVISDGYITERGRLAAASCALNGAACSDVSVGFTTVNNNPAPTQFIFTPITDGSVWFARFTLNSNITPGSYSASRDKTGGAVYLTVIAPLVVASAPEPATWAMMLLGFGMVAGVSRHRRKSANVIHA